MIKKNIHLIRQLGTTDCGIACLTMIFQYYRYKIDITELNATINIGRNGMSLAKMKEIVEYHGFSFKAYENYSIEENLIKSLPVIMFSKENHYVVISKKKRNNYILLDPIDGEQKISYQNIKKLYYNIIILIRPTKNPIKKIKTQDKFKILINKKKFLLAILLTLITQSIILIPPLIIQNIINQVSIHNVQYDIIKFIIIISIVGISYFVSNLLKKYIILLLQNDIYMNVISQMINKLFDIDLSFFESHSSGDLENRFNSVNDIYEFISSLLTSTIIDILTALLCGAVMIYQSILLTIIIIIITILQLIFVFILNYKIRLKTQNYIADKSKLEGNLIETLTNIQQIRCMRIDRLLCKNLKSSYMNIIKCLKEKIEVSNLMESGVSSFNIITSLVLYVIGGEMILQGRIMLGTLIAFVTLSSYFIKPFMTLSLIIPQINTLRETMIRLKELINYPNVNQSGEKSIKHFESLEMKEVSFSYSNNNCLDIDHVTLKINDGEKIAIVGTSGSGKTTLTKLLLNVITKYSGAIYLNCEDIKNIKREDIDRIFAVVTQIPMAINGTIRNNIDIGHVMSDEDIYKYLELVELKESILKFPLGVNTFIGENGQNISGGQRQRIAIARALASSPEILIFDEATSNLDPITEKKIYTNLKKLKITQIIVTHRLSAIQDADRIYVIENGKIIEEGTHKELIKKEGMYYQSIIE